MNIVVRRDYLVPDQMQLNERYNITVEWPKGFSNETSLFCVSEEDTTKVFCLERDSTDNRVSECKISFVSAVSLWASKRLIKNLIVTDNQYISKEEYTYDKGDYDNEWYPYLSKLENARVFSVTVDKASDRCTFMEMCDQVFRVELSKEEVLLLSQELHHLASTL